MNSYFPEYLELNMISVHRYVRITSLWARKKGASRILLRPFKILCALRIMFFAKTVTHADSFTQIP